MERPKLLFTIDVEEDMPGWEITDPITVQNVSALPMLADMCAELGVRPTYLCTYPVITEPMSAKVIHALHQRGDCEIGTHLHPWNTPPYKGLPGRDIDERQVPYYQYELGPQLFRAKLDVLHQAITELCGTEPVSFRAGRFGIDAATLAILPSLGYQVDSSVTPLEEHLDDDGPDFRSAPQAPYRPSAGDVSRPGDLPIVEIPVSVALTHRLPRLFTKAFVHLPKATHLRGLLSRDYLRIVDFAWLYPARFDLELMRKAAATLRGDKNPIFNVFIHSSELIPGASGRIRTEADVAGILQRTRAILRTCIEEYGAVPRTLGEAGRELRPSLGLEPIENA